MGFYFFILSISVISVVSAVNLLFICLLCILIPPLAPAFAEDPLNDTDLKSLTEETSVDEMGKCEVIYCRDLIMLEYESVPVP